MGITGLIPFMEKASCQANVSMFKGGCAAIDAYCWLHKGAYTCAEKLARGEPTEAYVVYCMKFVNMLLSHNIKPIMVFDGRYLPAKAGTEKKRRESREISRKRAAELLRAGRTEEARNHLRRCVDVSHEMALKLIQECRRRNVDCIVAPYEADAQLGYLNMKNIAQVIITEDSDLILFGCTKILFKMDINGNGILVVRDRLHLTMDVRVENFDFDKFRYMCILSGCDYLPSLPGIGLGKACKFLKRTSDPDIHKALARMPMFLNMLQLPMTPEYRDEFLRADATFRYQLVYDPLTRSQTTLTDTPPGYKPSDFTGKPLPDDVAFQLALGNLDPFTLNQMDTFDPDKPTPIQGGKTASWKQSPRAPHASIWKPGYKLRPIAPSIDPRTVERPLTKGKVVNLRSPVKKVDAPDTSLTNTELASIYGVSPPAKKVKQDLDAEAIEDALLEATPKKILAEEEPLKSPIIKCSSVRRNPFARGEKKAVVQSVPSPVKYKCKFSALERFSKRKDSGADGSPVQSRYFASEDANSPTKRPHLETSSEDLNGTESSPEKRKSRSPRKIARKYITNDGRTVISPVKEFFKEFDPNTEKVDIISISNPHEDGEAAFVKDEKIPESLHSEPNVTDQKESNSICGKRNLTSTFNWGSLQDKFGYSGSKKCVLKSTASVAKSFKLPTAVNAIDESGFGGESLLEEQSVDDPSPPDDDQIDDSGVGLQATAVDAVLSNTNENNATNFFSDDGYKSLTPPKTVIGSSKPCRPFAVGLRKSKSNISNKSDPKQQTLLNMFGFKGNSTKKIVRH